MSDLPVRLEVLPERVALLTLDRPERLNALSSEVAAAIADAVTSVTADPAVRSIVVAGEGRVFCAGADIAELRTLEGPHEFSAFVARLADAMQALARCPKPSVAAIHGVAFGGGLELALACDVRVADENAQLGVPEIKLGLLPGATGTARLSRMLTPAIAKQLLMTGEPLSAADAARLGLINQIVPSGGAREAALELARRLAALPPLALAAAKRLVDDGASMSLESAIIFERETVSILFATEDRVEGLNAFIEKRAPTFGGA